MSREHHSDITVAPSAAASASEANSNGASEARDSTAGGSVTSEVGVIEQTVAGGAVNSIFSRRSNFLTTSRILKLFGAGVKVKQTNKQNLHQLLN